MTDMWLGYAERAARREVLMALRRIAPGSAVVFTRSAHELRERFGEEEPGTVGAIVGHTGDGVSDLNLAAALVHDGLASEVVLAARGASGSLRSRAQRAGVARVVDATVAPTLEAALSRRKLGREVADVAAGHQGAGSEGVADRATPAPEATDGRDERADHGTQAQAGASEAPPAPVDPTRREAGSAPILTLASGRGGVGKTALAALMAGIAARWGMSVALVDLDLSCGNLHACFGIAKGPDLARIAPSGGPTPETMGRSCVRCNERVRLWGPCERPEMAEVVMPHVATLLSHLSSHADLVLVDTSTTFTDGVAQAVQSCDRLIVVHDERAGAVASAARASALAVRLGVARTRIVRVANLGDPRSRPSAFEGRAEVGLETARMHRVVDGGVEAEELLSSGKVDELVSTSSDVVMGVSALLARTLVELGRLPDDDAARKASEYRGRRPRLALFGRRREAV